MEGLHIRISSTLSGTGSATAKKILRTPNVKLAKDIPELSPFLADVSKEINEALDDGGKVLLEGTQGFGLSLHHSLNYPKTTSRDTTASGFLSEVGVSPFFVKDIILVVRTFPIRVAGEQAGNLENEITWTDIQKESGYPFELGEFTSVTKLQRRVGRFEEDVVRRAVLINRPTKIAVHGLDYISYEDFGKTEMNDLSWESINFLKNLFVIGKTKIDYLFTGPDLNHLIDLSIEDKIKEDYYVSK